MKFQREYEIAERMEVAGCGLKAVIVTFQLDEWKSIYNYPTLLDRIYTQNIILIRRELIQTQAEVLRMEHA
jgi:hypothetical protein